MKSDSTKELADRLDAEERLRKRGYTKRRCDTCKGGTDFRLAGRCYSCGGKGFRWSGPMMRFNPNILEKK